VIEEIVHISWRIRRDSLRRRAFLLSFFLEVLEEFEKRRLGDFIMENREVLERHGDIKFIEEIEGDALYGGGGDSLDSLLSSEVSKISHRKSGGRVSFSLNFEAEEDIMGMETVVTSVDVLINCGGIYDSFSLFTMSPLFSDLNDYLGDEMDEENIRRALLEVISELKGRIKKKIEETLEALKSIEVKDSD